jgi:hypothetical protein
VSRSTPTKRHNAQPGCPGSRTRCPHRAEFPAPLQRPSRPAPAPLLPPQSPFTP